MRPDALLLQDIVDAIDECAASLPITLEAFQADKFVRSHILPQIQIIGEAAWRVADPLKSANPEVPWRQIAGMRHVLVHDYYQVNWDRVYITARDHVPALRTSVIAMLARAKGTP